MRSTDWLTPELIRRLESLQLAVRWVRSGHTLGGRFPINRRGSSVEFADYSPYVPGDDIRAIDWNLYARLDRLYVKTYKEEIELGVELLIDATASMGLPTPAKFERAQQLAICLGYIALANRHHVRVSWVSPGRLATSRRFRQRGDLRPMVEAMEGARPQGQLAFAEWVQRAVAALRLRGGQAIFITDGMIRPADFFRAAHWLMMRHLELRVIQVLSEEELHPGRAFRGGLLVDTESGATHQLGYSAEELARAVIQHNEQLVRFCKRHGIPFARCLIEEPLEACLMQTLPARGFLV